MNDWGMASGCSLKPQGHSILSQIVLLFLVTGMLSSCTGNDGMIRPSDRIGKMRVNRYGHINAAVIWDYCSDAMTAEPGIQTTECKVPLVDELFLGLGVAGVGKTQRDALWEARTWELSIDGYPIDLNAFNIADFDGNGDGASYEYRVWRIRLRNLTEGEHTLYYVMHVNRQVEGDPSSLLPGIYELVVNFTVEK